MTPRSLVGCTESGVATLVELAAIEALDVIGHEAVMVSRLRDLRADESGRHAWRTSGRPPLALDLEALVVARLADRFPDHAVIGADRPSVITTRWRWLVGIAETGDWGGTPGDSLVSIALLSGDTPWVGALVDLVSGDIVIGRRGVGDDKQRGLDLTERPGDRRLFLETGRSCGGRWEASALSRMARAHHVEPRMLGSAAAALLTVARGGGTVLAIGVHERELAAGVLVAEQAGLESIWWRETWPLAHVLVGRTDDLAPLVSAATDVVRTWSGASASFAPAAAAEWTL